MFEDSLVESAALLHTRNRWPALLSITTQCAVAVLIVALPVFHPELLPPLHTLPTAIVPPRTPIVPPAEPPLAPAHSSAVAMPQAVATPVAQIASCACDRLRPTGHAVDAPNLPLIDIAGEKNPLLPPGISSSNPHVTVGPPAPTASSRPHISSGVSAGLLLAPIRPQYPEIARITHTEGTVIVEAVISRTGTIESARVISGPTVLQRAALAAVQEARYRPFLLNGQPTDVQTTVTVIFRMSS